MAFPAPVPGLVIRYAFLWRAEVERGREEASKGRPCAVLLTTRTAGGNTVVMALPITHTPPADPAFAIEIPRETKMRLGLDDERSWVVVTDANRFIWPGPDLRFAKAGDAASAVYGILPAGLYNQIREKWLRAYDSRKAAVTTRTS